MCLKKNNILFIFTIIFFFIVFLITNKKNTPPYDVVSESLIIGRLLESERSSLFSYSGLTGVIAQSDEDYYKNALLQFELLENKDLNNLFFFTYNSQPGFQAFLYASFNKISPFNIKTNINILQKITMLLNSIIFSLFLMWCYRNFGKIPYLTSLILLASSSWIHVFSHSLWWCLWAFYLPFIFCLLFFEKNKKANFKFYVYLFLSLLVKCLINGFEFISTTILAALVAILYYILNNKTDFKKSFLLFLKSGTAMFFSVLVAASILVLQISSLKGSLKNGLDHIFFSYITRTSHNIVLDTYFSYIENKYINISIKYLGNNVFNWMPIEIPFAIIIFCIFLIAFLIYKKQKTLVITTLSSLTTALYWHFIFIQHSAIHDHINFIIWYIPFLLFGFLCIGVGIRNIFEQEN